MASEDEATGLSTDEEVAGGNAWDVFGPDPLTEDRIRREIRRLRR